ncbi:hypothetical protein [Vibrio hepatarius]|uniref:hypothetical protein n=1 Tax=Vibrio hepatarius TaxID=171383 RepID=UPI001C0A4244|nr:hypothetical protein [Vibrio hepatarius]MBU2898273.1 hypothetical protein [Vibrio hepatarius]
MPLKVILFVVATSTLFLSLSSSSAFGRELLAGINKKLGLLSSYIVSRQLKAVSLALSSCVLRTYDESLIRYFTHHAFHALKISPHVKGKGLFGDTDTHYEVNAFDGSHSVLEVACLSSVTLVF